MSTGGFGFYALDVGLGIVTAASSNIPLRIIEFGFYALDVGLGIVTLFGSLTIWLLGFYALDVGLGIVTVRPAGAGSERNRVSMPSMSGWAL
jgi:hypothetical protein